MNFTSNLSKEVAELLLEKTTAVNDCEGFAKEQILDWLRPKKV